MEKGSSFTPSTCPCKTPTTTARTGWWAPTWQTTHHGMLEGCSGSWANSVGCNGRQRSGKGARPCQAFDGQGLLIQLLAPVRPLLTPRTGWWCQPGGSRLPRIAFTDRAWRMAWSQGPVGRLQGLCDRLSAATVQLDHLPDRDPTATFTQTESELSSPCLPIYIFHGV